MDGIRATRSSTGEAVEIDIVDDGRLEARTPDGSVLQTQALRASRVKLAGDRLTWSGVKYDVDDQVEAKRFVDSLGGPGRRMRRVTAVAAVFVVGVALGVVGGALLVDRTDSVGCDEARDVVENAVQSMEQINDTDEQDQSFFAAMIVEQRTITYTMDVASDCFSLTERAAAEGLLEGIRGLLNVAPG